MARSLNVVQDGVEKASKVSPRSGKWATPKEIDLKTSPKQTPLQSLLTQLVKDSRIEKKAGTLLYRPQQGAGGGEGKGHKERGDDDRGKDRGKDWKDPDDGKYPRKYPDKPTGRRRGKPSDDADRERRNKIEQDRERRRREEAAKNGKKKPGRRELSKTVARGVVAQAVAGSVARQAAQKAVYTAIL
jgi:hypothetical protein